MSNVQFEENITEFTSRKILGEAVVPGATKLLMKTGLLKSSKQAEYVLMGTIVICILITIVVLYKNFHHLETKTGPSAVVQNHFINK